MGRGIGGDELVLTILIVAGPVNETDVVSPPVTLARRKLLERFSNVHFVDWIRVTKLHRQVNRRKSAAPPETGPGAPAQPSSSPSLLSAHADPELPAAGE